MGENSLLRDALNFFKEHVTNSLVIPLGAEYVDEIRSSPEIFDELVRYLQDGINSASDLSTALWDSRLLKFVAWMRWNIKRALLNHRPVSFEHLDTCVRTALDRWTRELREELQNLRSKCDKGFELFENQSFQFAKWQEFSIVTTVYPEIYPTFAYAVTKNIGVFAGCMTDFFINSMDHVRASYWMAREFSYSEKLYYRTISKFCRWTISAVMAQRNFLLQFATSSRFYVRTSEALAEIQKDLMSKSFVVSYVDNTRIELGSPRFRDREIYRLMRDDILTCETSFFEEDIIVTIFTNNTAEYGHGVNDVNSAGTERSIVDGVFPSGTIVVTGRNVLLKEHWLYELLDRHNLRVEVVKFSENSKVEDACVESIQSFVPLCWAHFLLICDMNRSCIISELDPHFWFNLWGICLNHVLSLCSEHQNRLSGLQAKLFWTLLMNNACRLVNECCGHKNAQNPEVGFRKPFWYIQSSVEIVMKILDEIPETVLRSLIGGICKSSLSEALEHLRELKGRLPENCPDLMFDFDGVVASLSYVWKKVRGGSEFHYLIPTGSHLIPVGTTGFIFKGFDQDLNRIVIYKQVKATQDEAVIQEIDYLKYLRYQFVINTYGFHVTDKATFLKLGYCPQGSIKDQIQNNGPVVCPRHLSRIAFQILMGLSFLHSKQIVHGSLTPSNILVDLYGVVQLTDFGSARYVAPSANRYQKGVIHSNTRYLAPKTVRDGQTTLASDIWSFGCVLYYMITGKQPFSEISESMPIIMKLGRGEVFDLSLLQAARGTVGNSIIDVAIECLQNEQEKRPLAIILSQHPFLYMPHMPLRSNPQ